jgi:4-amino-4-deoxy-L-arabinose transferase-like glycosyltransferase
VPAPQARMKTAWEIPQGLRGALLLGGFLRVFFLFIADNNGGDAIARAAKIQQWMSHPSFVSPVAHWGPVYFYLTGTVGFLLKDAELAGRLLSLICGITSIYLVYRLTKLLSGETAATLAAFICGLAGLHVGYSTTSSSEMPYLFFLLIGLIGFFEYVTTGNLWSLVSGAICFSVAAGIRYEAWIFFPFLCLLLVWPLTNFFRAGLGGGEGGSRSHFLCSLAAGG